MTGKVCKGCRAQVASVDGSEFGFSGLSFFKSRNSRQGSPANSEIVTHKKSPESLQVDYKIKEYNACCEEFISRDAELNEQLKRLQQNPVSILLHDEINFFDIFCGDYGSIPVFGSHSTSKNYYSRFQALCDNYSTAVVNKPKFSKLCKIFFEYQQYYFEKLSKLYLKRHFDIKKRDILYAFLNGLRSSIDAKQFKHYNMQLEQYKTECEQNATNMESMQDNFCHMLVLHYKMNFPWHWYSTASSSFPPAQETPEQKVQRLIKNYSRDYSTLQKFFKKDTTAKLAETIKLKLKQIDVNEFKQTFEAHNSNPNTINNDNKYESDLRESFLAYCKETEINNVQDALEDYVQRQISEFQKRKTLVRTIEHTKKSKYFILKMQQSYKQMITEIEANTSTDTYTLLKCLTEVMQTLLTTQHEDLCAAETQYQKKIESQKELNQNFYRAYWQQLEASLET
jgi:hypothetical protein